jgi:hypothetical protein
MSMQRVIMDGVRHRRLIEPVEPQAILSFASRRGDASTVVRRFVTLVREAAGAYR